MKNTYNDTKLLRFSKPQWSELKQIAAIEDNLERQDAFRNYFLQPEIFDTVKEIVDPSWLAYDIYLNADSYGL